MLVKKKSTVISDIHSKGFYVKYQAKLLKALLYIVMMSIFSFVSSPS